MISKHGPMKTKAPKSSKGKNKCDLNCHTPHFKHRWRIFLIDPLGEVLAWVPFLCFRRTLPPDNRRQIYYEMPTGLADTLISSVIRPMYIIM